ncbi:MULTISPECIES: hypothetical protein [Rhizobium/Agrobacterium group]|uniref:Uncharacterized protein n=2 Tax=Neorhizobium TaxID=1525371 RepID=A0ABV0M3A6_9HYPH|nr:MULTISPECIES: hypothetical protein [Rhizobium/Agrobacterium group]MCC2609417.1 hypothetical protein [Neorhizobium petrolearium]WGI69631.1 hypothetical protein QEO92_06020 [Neorhizobium petrolearium]
MTDMQAQSCRALQRCGTANVRSESGNYCRSPVLLTDAQGQGTKMASTVAREGKQRAFQGFSAKPLKSCENKRFPASVTSLLFFNYLIILA